MTQLDRIEQKMDSILKALAVQGRDSNPNDLLTVLQTQGIDAAKKFAHSKLKEAGK